MNDRERARATAHGQTDWGQHASAAAHHRYIDRLPNRYRRRCDCGCNTRASHAGRANGLALTTGCELSMRRWAHPR